MNKGLIAALIAGCVALMGFFAYTGIYNGLVERDQAAEAQWAQVENAYQRRADLVPNLVETVKAAGAFEKETLTAVVEARASVGQVSAGAVEAISKNPESMKRFQAVQDGLGSALSRLLMVQERYPDLKANKNYQDLMAQLEGSENRIAVERRKYNQAAQECNVNLGSYFTSMVAGRFPSKFQTRAYFKADEGSKAVPRVKFS